MNKCSSKARIPKKRKRAIALQIIDKPAILAGFHIYK
jgi:hypothetical protein